MSHETVERRAAEIRRHWSKDERRKRARASDLRCAELVSRICGVRNATAGSWSVRKPA
jgi:hypothetical protein